MNESHKTKTKIAVSYENPAGAGLRQRTNATVPNRDKHSPHAPVSEMDGGQGAVPHGPGPASATTTQCGLSPREHGRPAAQHKLPHNQKTLIMAATVILWDASEKPKVRL